MDILGLEIPTYCEDDNPIKRADSTIIDWTIDRRDVIKLEKIFKTKCKGVKKKRNLVKRNSSDLNSINGVSDTSKIVKLDIKEENVNSEDIKTEPVENVCESL